MTNREKLLYKLALESGHKRFGSACKHQKTKSGYCRKCLRKIK